jgi:ATP-binding cassette subfamily C protein CydCD
VRTDRRLLRRIPALRVHLAVSVAAAVATAAAVLAQAEVLAGGIADLVAGRTSAAGSLAVALVAIGAVRGAARWATDLSATAATAAARRQVTGDVIAKLDALDEAGRRSAHPSEVSALASSGIDALEPWIRSYLPALSLAAVVPIAAGLRIMVADLWSAVILIVTVPLIPVFMVLIGRLTDERSRRGWATMQRLGAHFHDVLVGLETLRLFGRAEAQIERVRRVTDDYRQAVMRTLRVAFLSALALELLATLSVALVAVTAGVRLAHGDLDLTTALVVLLLAPECSLPLRRVGAAFHAATAGTDALDDLERFDQLSETPDGPIDHLHREVRMSATGLVVTDGERGHRVGPIDLQVTGGELVALVGPTGSGKSTVLGVLAGDVALTAGRVEVNGLAVDTLARSTRRAAVQSIPQFPRPLGATVDASVALGCPEASAAARRAALAEVDLDQLADRRPDELSGGELQRLAVARALLTSSIRPAGVLLADEPTAHLDPENATLVGRALRRVADAGVAVVVVTHDRSIEGLADRVTALRLDHADSPIDRGAERGAEPGTAPGTGPGRAAGAAWEAASGGADGAAETSRAERQAPRLLPEPIAGDGADSARDAGRVGDLAWFGRLAPVARGRTAGARALGIAAEACTVGLAGTAAWLILRAAERPSFADLAVVAVAVRAFGLGKGVLRYAERLASHDATLRRLGAIRAAVVARLGRLVPAGVPRTGRGELLAAVVDDVDRLGDLELRIVGPAVSALTVASGAIVGVAAVAGRPALALAAGAVVAGIVLPAWVARRSSATAAPLAESRAARSSTLLDLAEGCGEIASIGATAAWKDPLDLLTERVCEIERSRGRRAAAASGLSAALGAWTAAATALLVGGPAAASGPAIGVAVLVPLAVIELLSPAVPGAELVHSVAASAARLRALLSRPDPTPEPATPASPGPTVDIVLDDARFGWPDGPAIWSHLDVSIREGDHVAVRGPSGSGKSTLAAGLAAFLRPRSGAYRLGGVDTESLGGAQVRRAVTWCTQDPWLADTSIRENLRLAAPEALDPQLWDALDTMRLGDWVRSMPEGLDTLLGRGGVAASGGQRQRLALARVLLADHHVIVLDEPTAHLDADTGTGIMRDLTSALAGRSMIAIGHADFGVAFDTAIEAPTRRAAEPLDHSAGEVPDAQ